MLKLLHVIRARSLTLGALARTSGLSRPSLSLLANHGLYPKRVAAETTQGAICTALAALGVPAEELEGIFAEVAEPCSRTARPMETPLGGGITTGVDMLIRKQSLSHAAREHFQIAGDPFGPPSGREAVYLAPALRVVYEHMLAKARHGGMLAIVGESGSGKTTLKDLLLDDLAAGGSKVTVIEPLIIGMEADDRRGRTLKAAHIGDAIMRAVAPTAQRKASSEARMHQVQQALAEACAADPTKSHLLVIEEAHRLPLPTLRHLKNFLEMKSGLRRLLSIVLLGQPELALRLSPHDMTIREVWQRCEVARLAPLDKKLLADYLRSRLGKAAEALTPEALERLTYWLTDRTGNRSYLYPLAVNNWVVAALNLAAAAGARSIKGETFDETKKHLDDEMREGF